MEAPSPWHEPLLALLLPAVGQVPGLPVSARPGQAIGLGAALESEAADTGPSRRGKVTGHKSSSVLFFTDRRSVLKNYLCC